MTSIGNFSFSGRKVLIRVDFNVPLGERQEITDDTKIRASLPTLKKILSDKGSPIIMSHLGRPKGKEDKFSLRHIRDHVASLLGVNVMMADDCTGPSVRALASELKPGEALLLENTRFYDAEKMGDPAFAKELASLGDVYVNDAFATAHRPHASTTVIAGFFSPENRMFGYLMEAEVINAEKMLNFPARPFTLVLGGAKVSDKILLIEHLLDRVDNLLIGGAMAFTFLKAMGKKIGASRFEEDKIEVAESMMEKASSAGVKLMLPADVVSSDRFDNDGKIVTGEEVPDGFMGLDIGPATIRKYAPVLLSSRKILWNGTMGVYEFPNFAAGSRGIGEVIAEATRNGAYSLVGGGDTVAAVRHLGLMDKISHAPTGGGALLTYFEGKELPGIKAIREAVHSA